jgi:formylglycine-generating enzyme required for sulfatase activity
MFLRSFWIFISVLFLSVLLISSPGEAPPGMVLVKGGTFGMGADERVSKEKPVNLSNYYIEKKPVHPVTLKSFYIGKYEVTRAEWNMPVGAGWNPAIICTAEVIIPTKWPGMKRI